MVARSIVARFDRCVRVVVTNGMAVAESKGNVELILFRQDGVPYRLGLLHDLDGVDAILDSFAAAIAGAIPFWDLRGLLLKIDDVSFANIGGAASP